MLISRSSTVFECTISAKTQEERHAFLTQECPEFRAPDQNHPVRCRVVWSATGGSSGYGDPAEVFRYDLDAVGQRAWVPARMYDARFQPNWVITVVVRALALRSLGRTTWPEAQELPNGALLVDLGTL